MIGGEETDRAQGHQDVDLRQGKAELLRSGFHELIAALSSVAACASPGTFAESS